MSLAQREMGQAWQQLQGMEPAQQRDMLLELVPAIIDKYGSISSTAAADWYKRMRSKWFDDKYEPILADPIHDDLTDMIRAKASMLFKGNERYDPNAYLSYLNRLIAVGVRNGGRSTVRSAAKLDKYGPRFARVPSGLHTCAFCAMLAGRGFVYASAEKAGGLFNKYHAACDCEIVPSWDEKPRVEGYRPDELYDDYLKARDEAGSDSVDDILRAMRQHKGKYADGIRPGTAIPDGWKQPHAQNEERLLSMRGLAGVTDREWYMRQEKVGVPHSTDMLYPQEIVFLERFQNLGNHVEWIPRDIEKRTATNDFRWIETNELCELKSLAKADFGKIADRITKAVRSAKENHDVVKDCFVIDLGQSKRKDKLVHQLEKYNDREWKIRRLFILDGEGLLEIKLK
ncbi:VG15 protein [Bifidobacterium adolescentis]|uniref:VG15 protein n=1 Tax=Bifidobacterium adolescentis TaxID=1680 RepID=UPI003FEEF7F7